MPPRGVHMQRISTRPRDRAEPTPAGGWATATGHWRKSWRLHRVPLGSCCGVRSRWCATLLKAEQAREGNVEGPRRQLDGPKLQVESSAWFRLLFLWPCVAGFLLLISGDLQRWELAVSGRQR